MSYSFKNKIILVTGVGSIGSSIVRKLVEHKPKQIRCFDMSEYSLYKLQNDLKKHDNIRYLVGDIRDKDRLSRSFVDVDCVIHAAALKHVSFCEYNPDEAYKTNILGTQNIVDLAREHNLEHALLISTDKAVQPTTVMGTTKLLAEKLFINAPEHSNSNKTKFTVVRFGNVFGSAGSVVETFWKKIKNKQQVSVSDLRLVRYFMSIDQAASLVINSIFISKGKQIFILKMKKAKIIDLAKRINFSLHGNEKVDHKVGALLPGEKLDESLCSEFEKTHLQETEQYYIISPWINEPHYKQKTQSQQVEFKDEMLSDLELDSLINEWRTKNG